MRWQVNEAHSLHPKKHLHRHKPTVGSHSAWQSQSFSMERKREVSDKCNRREKRELQYRQQLRTWHNMKHVPYYISISRQLAMDDFESTSLIRFPSSTPQLDMVHPPPPKGNPSIRTLFLLRAQRVYGRRLRAVPQFSSGAEIRHPFNDQRDLQLASHPASPGPSNHPSADPASPEGITVGERMRAKRQQTPHAGRNSKQCRECVCLRRTSGK
jgi:hypothetical protein